MHNGTQCGNCANKPGYDAASNRTNFTDPENGSSSYVYDTLNRLQTLTPPTAFGTGSFGLGYDALSRRTSLTRPNTVNTSYGCDNLSRLLNVTHAKGGVTLDGATYTVDNAGNRTAKSDLHAGVTTNYGYDNIYELLSATQGGSATESYTYDPVGNRLTALGSAAWSYNTSNELNSRPGVSYAFDANGNTIVKTDGTGSTSYTWDYENRLASVILPGSGGTVSFKYDPFGRRIYKSSSSGTSIYAYDGPKLIEETNSSGTVVARYSQGESLDEPLAMLRSSTTTYYERDGLGSVTSLTDATGALAQTYAFDSFGNQTASSGSLTNPFQYVSREFDSEATLYFMRARYFDPKTGRFLSEDKIRSAPENANPYAYVGNAPVRFNDPMGFVRVDTSFPAKCLSDLMRAIGIVRRAAQANAKCNCQFKGMDQQGRSLQDLLDSPDITIHYDPVQEPPPDYEGPGELVGYTLPGDTNDIWMNPYACNMGRWTLASTLVHELTHIALKPGMGQEDKADIAKITCGFPQTVMPTTIVVRP